MKKILVVKLGRNVVLTEDNQVDIAHVAHLAAQVKALQTHGYYVVLVVSCAVACGSTIGSIDIREGSHLEQLAASIGQAHAMHHLYSIFQSIGLSTGQLLLTRSDLSDKKKKRNVKKVMLEAVKKGIILLVNENDVIELNSFAGNDYLAVAIAKLIHADTVMLLSDIDGVYDAHMEVIHTYFVNKFYALGKDVQRKKQGIGGIEAKITAAKQSAYAGIHTVIAHGRKQNLLIDLILNNKHHGTHFIYHQKKHGK